MPNRKRDTTIRALMLDVLEPVREVRDTAQAKATAAQQCCETVCQMCQHRSLQPLNEDARRQWRGELTAYDSHSQMPCRSSLSFHTQGSRPLLASAARKLEEWRSGSRSSGERLSFLVVRFLRPLCGLVVFVLVGRGILSVLPVC